MISGKEVICICSCSCLDHAIRFSLIDRPDVDDNYVEMYVEVGLAPERSFLERIRTAFRYVFGEICGFGSVAEVIIKPEDAYKLVDILQEFIQKEKYYGRGHEKKDSMDKEIRNGNI